VCTGVCVRACVQNDIILHDGKLANSRRPFLNTNVAQGKGSRWDQMTIWRSRLVVILQTAPLGFDSRSHNSEMKFPDYIRFSDVI